MTALSADITVIGGGPAGLSAATAAARAGARVHLIDSAPVPGGQYWMQPIAGHASTQSIAGMAAIERARSAGVVMHMGADVWGVFPGFSIAASIGSQPLEIVTTSIVVAAGAHDRVPAFPGWTLPGVLTAGAAQRLAKLGSAPAGKRVVVAGSGPFLAVVAGGLRALDVQLVAYLEARRPMRALAAHVAGFPDRWFEAFALLRTFTALKTQRRFGWIVTEALGTDRVEAIRIAQLDRNGTIDSTQTRIIDNIDALVTGWGFRPQIEITAQLGCVHAFDDARGGWFCDVDAWMRTSLSGVYAAGEITGVAGARAAQLGGQIAGETSAEDLGFAQTRSPAKRALRRRFARSIAFATGLNALFAPPRSLTALAQSDTIVCRCESISAAAIIAAAREGATGAYGAKIWTRAGMGRCQGRMCGWTIAQLLARDGDIARPGFNQPRIPLRPVPLETVAAMLDEETGNA